jgi:hypothetical protein
MYLHLGKILVLLHQGENIPNKKSLEEENKMALGKWGKKLDKELSKTYTEDQQESFQWFPDVESDQTYQWVFKTGNGSLKHRWTICKMTNKITKTKA